LFALLRHPRGYFPVLENMSIASFSLTLAFHALSANDFSLDIQLSVAGGYQFSNKFKAVFFVQFFLVDLQ
jgi:hypothetical protein